MENGTLIAVREIIFSKNNIEGKLFLGHPPIRVPKCCSSYAKGAVNFFFYEMIIRVLNRAVELQLSLCVEP